MDLQRIEKFIDAGYTKEEIELLFKDPKIDPQADKSEENTDNSNAAETKSQTTDTMTETINTLIETVTTLSDTVKSMQTANINKAHTDKAKGDSILDTMKSFVDTL